MSVKKIKFEFKKRIFNNRFSIPLFISIIGLPIILFRNGVFDLTNLPIFFVILGNVIYFSLTNVYTIKIFENTTEFKNVFGKTKIIPNNKITYSETYFAGKDTMNNKFQTLKLEIKFLSKRVTLFKNEEENYDSFIKYCKKNYSRFPDKTINYWNYFIPTLIFSFGIYFFIFTRNSFIKQSEDNLTQIQKYGYVKIVGTFKDYETIGRNINEVWFHLYEYPKFDFSPIDFSKNKSKYYNLKKNGEKTIIYISPNEYKKKIIQNIPLKFYDKFFQYNEITAYKVE